MLAMAMEALQPGGAERRAARRPGAGACARALALAQLLALAAATAVSLERPDALDPMRSRPDALGSSASDPMGVRQRLHLGAFLNNSLWAGVPRPLAAPAAEPGLR